MTSRTNSLAVAPLSPAPVPAHWPTDLELPDKDGIPVENLLQSPQNDLLSDSLQPILRRIHPDERYFLARDVGIYWDYDPDEPLRRCKAPDWFYVPNATPTIEGRFRRSYVLWREQVLPVVALEFVSGTGAEEHDPTPQTGKFWVYEQAIRIEFYGIFDAERNHLEVYRLIAGRYQPLRPNERGRFLIDPLGVELGTWHGRRENYEGWWLRWFDPQGNLLLTAEEELQKVRERTQRLQEKLRALGIDPDQV